MHVPAAAMSHLAPAGFAAVRTSARVTSAKSAGSALIRLIQDSASPVTGASAAVARLVFMISPIPARRYAGPAL